MKRYGNLYDKVISLENLRLADDIARKGKKRKFGVRQHDKHREEHLLSLHETLKKCEFKTSKYTHFEVREPKVRTISKLPYYPDRIVQHAIMNVLEPIWVGSFTADTYANIKGRGIHKCTENLRHVLYIDRIGTKYCLKIDIKKYYPSIDHELLKVEVRRKIKDVRLLKLIDGIIDSEEGLPIGNYLSQYLANVFLSRFDHRMKEVYHVRYYFRYVDDMVFLADTKEELMRILAIVRKELAGLKLEIKKNWQIFPVDSRGIDFLGYVFYHGFTFMRKDIKKRIFKRIGQYNRFEISEKTFCQSMASWNGWIKWCDSKHLCEKINKCIVRPLPPMKKSYIFMEMNTLNQQTIIKNKSA